VTARLAAHVWVGAYLARLRLAAIPAYVLARGDPTAGAVAVKLATLDGRAALWRRMFDPAAEARAWVRISEGPEPEIDASLARERARDPDLWVIEVEDRQGRHLLDTEGMEG
jgi:hypothetical protein